MAAAAAAESSYLRRVRLLCVSVWAGTVRRKREEDMKEEESDEAKSENDPQFLNIVASFGFYLRVCVCMCV